MKVWNRVLVMVICAFGAHGALAAKADGYARLDEFMRELQGFEAEFKQVVKDSQGRSVEEASGVLAIKRPNRFRWDYRQPHTQAIVADGTKVWLYDPDLEQVSVRRLDQTFAGTPAMLLSGDGDLRTAFTVEIGEKRNGVEWLILTPKKPETDFKRVRLGLRGTMLAGMELSDKLGQITVLEFSNVVRNPIFNPDRFVFTPPPGVDVIGGETPKK